MENIVFSEPSVGLGLDEAEADRLRVGKGSGKGGKMVAKDAAKVLRNVPHYETRHLVVISEVVNPQSQPRGSQ